MSRGSNKGKARNWVFVLNNPDGHLQDWEGKVRYAIYSEEVGIEGNYHFQGYVELDAPRSLQWLQANLDRSAHWEPRRGSKEQAIAYCRKTHDPTFVAGPYEIGTMSEQGKRTDLHEIKEMLDNGATLSEVANGHFPSAIRYHKGLIWYKSLISEKRVAKTEVHVHYGKPGYGKTFFATEYSKSTYMKPPNQWWDGYEGEDNVVLDEFTGWLTYTQLKLLLDRYPLKVEVKGGSVEFVSKTIHITSNTEPGNYYDWSKVGSMDAFTRRVEKWYFWTEYMKYQVFTDYKDFEAAVCNHKFIQ